MKKLIPLLFILLTSVDRCEPAWADAPLAVPTVSVHSISGATVQEEQMIAEGVQLANRVLAGPCYKQWVLAATYTENNGLTQAQIWDLMAAQPVTVDVEMYLGDWRANHWAKTVGYENDPYDGVVHMNRYFVKTATMVADNLVHEGEGHSQGFHHYGAFSTSDPYGQNYALEGCLQAQEQQAPGGKRFKPPGIRIEVRHPNGLRGHPQHRSAS